MTSLDSFRARLLTGDAAVRHNAQLAEDAAELAKLCAEFEVKRAEAEQRGLIHFETQRSNRQEVMLEFAAYGKKRGFDWDLNLARTRTWYVTGATALELGMSRALEADSKSA